MKRSRVRVVFHGLLVLAFLLHTDLWFWNDARIVAGVPVGLAYHVAYCLAVSGLLALLVRLAWPAELEAEEGPQRRS